MERANDPLAQAEGEAREHIVGYTLAYAGGHDELREDLDRYKAAILARVRGAVEALPDLRIRADRTVVCNVTFGGYDKPLNGAISRESVTAALDALAGES